MFEIEDEMAIDNVETCVQSDGVDASNDGMAVESINAEPVDAEMADELEEEHDTMVVDVDAVVGKSLRSQSQCRPLLTFYTLFTLRWQLRQRIQMIRICQERLKMIVRLFW